MAPAFLSRDRLVAAFKTNLIFKCCFLVFVSFLLVLENRRAGYSVVMGANCFGRGRCIRKARGVCRILIFE